MADAGSPDVNGGGECVPVVADPETQTNVPTPTELLKENAVQASAPSETTPVSTSNETPVVTSNETSSDQKPPSEPSPAAEDQPKPASKDFEEWQKRESVLLKTIEQLEKVKTEAGSDGLKLELKVREEEIDLLKSRIHNVETELAAAMSRPGPKNHEMVTNIKEQHEELLSKARGMIFDKTKMVKNQELQIAALTSQVSSLKDVAAITRDLLDIRNSEVKHLEDRLEAMEARFQAEKERHSLVLKRAETGTRVNDDLRKEYETQLALFKELRVKYEQRVQALVTENKRLSETMEARAALTAAEAVAAGQGGSAAPSS